MRPSTSAFVIAFLSVVALGGAAVLFEWFGLQRTYFYGTYVCGLCGAQRTVSRSGFAGFTHREEVKVHSTAVSRVLTAHQTRGCRHEWHVLRFSSGSRPVVGGREQTDWGVPFPTGLLLTNDAFAPELAATPRPREVWAALWRASEAAPEERRGLLGEWGGPPDEPFAQWWARNGERVKQLSNRRSAAGSQQ